MSGIYDPDTIFDNIGASYVACPFSPLMVKLLEIGLSEIERSELTRELTIEEIQSLLDIRLIISQWLATYP